MTAGSGQYGITACLQKDKRTCSSSRQRSGDWGQMRQIQDRLQAQHPRRSPLSPEGCRCSPRLGCRLPLPFHHRRHRRCQCPQLHHYGHPFPHRSHQPETATLDRMEIPLHRLCLKSKFPSATCFLGLANRIFDRLSHPCRIFPSVDDRSSPSLCVQKGDDPRPDLAGRCLTQE